MSQEAAPLKSRIRLLLMGVLGVIFGLATVAIALGRSSWDVSGLAAFGEESAVTLDYAEDLLGDVHLREAQGHDGKFFFVQATDPLFMDPDGAVAVLDRPAYRGQRMLYPLLAGMGGLLEAEDILWGLVVVNLLALGIGTVALAHYCQQHSVSIWFALAFPLNPGVVSELTIDGAGVLALALLLVALTALQSTKVVLGLVVLSMACLTREAMLISALGLAYWWWTDRKDGSTATLILAVPLVFVASWAVYLRARIPPGSGPSVQEFSLPMLGFVDSFEYWSENSLLMATAIGVMGIVALTLLQMLRGRRDALMLATVGFVPLALILSSQVWKQVFDISRALAPLLTAAIVNPDVLARSRNPNSRRTDQPAVRPQPDYE